MFSGFYTKALSLYSPGSHSFYDVLLTENVNNDNRHDAEHDHRHGGAQIHRAIAALQVLHVNGNGHIFGAVQNQVGKQVIVPHPHGLQNTHGDQGGLQHGQHHAEIRAQRAAAVNGRRFQIKRGVEVKLPKYVAEVLAQSAEQDQNTAQLIERESSRFAAEAEKLGV